MNGVLVFGVNTKVTEFIFRYPWRAILIFFVVIDLLVFLIERDAEWLLKPVVIVLPLLAAFVLLFQFLSRDGCYKVVIDNNKNIIRFYLMFNRGIIEEEIRDIKIIIDRACSVVVGGKRFVVFVETIHSLVASLPSNTTISFVGFFGHYKEEDWKIRNLKFKPGSKLMGPNP